MIVTPEDWYKSFWVRWGALMTIAFAVAVTTGIIFAVGILRWWGWWLA